ncbi:MAG: sulfatase-like hydrolase/transferase, partial [Verrucomicrobiae bacterium]|nr:sulfatase-like hydrolase/transferase [Verrucomicrobiae bacterium]
DLEPGEPGDYLTDALTDKALEILERETKRKRPLFLNLWYHAVHTPIEGKPDLVAKYQRKIASMETTFGKPEIPWNPDYAAMVEALDQNVGRVLRRIDELGIGDETVVVFTSDNGGFVNPCKLHPGVPVANNSPLRSGKGSCYEGGIRVPLIVRSPNASAQAGSTCRTPAWSCDLFPTLLGQCGLAGKTTTAVDGVDLSPLLKDPTAALKREALFFHYPHYYPTTTPVSAIRQGSWKLVEYLGDGPPPELYDLSTDLGESRNVADQHPAERDDLLSRLHQWRTSVDAQVPEPNPSSKKPKTP